MQKHKRELGAGVDLGGYVAAATATQTLLIRGVKKGEASLCLPTQERKRKLGADVDLGGYVAAATAT